MAARASVMTRPGPPHWVHATAVVLGERGVLIEGPSGSGKSRLADALILDGVAAGLFARLVGDDRVGLLVRSGRVVARPHPAVTGLIERRGIGLITVDHAPACVLHLVVRLVAGADLPSRLPAHEARAVLLGVSLPLLCVPIAASPRDTAGSIADALATLGRPPTL